MKKQEQLQGMPKVEGQPLPISTQLLEPADEEAMATHHSPSATTTPSTRSGLTEQPGENGPLTVCLQKKQDQRTSERRTRMLVFL